MIPSEGTIVVYGTSWCPDCVRAKLFLEMRHVPFHWVNVEQDEQAMAYIEQVNGGLHRVPTLVFPDGSVLVEPTNAELSRKLGG